jgi:hypothetical protein
LSKKLVMTACALAACGVALAKLPPPDAAAQAKAAEAAARAAWSAKVSAYKLCKVQDQIAARFGGRSGAMRTAGTMAPAGTTAAASGAAAPSASAAPTSAQAAAAILSANPQAAAASPAGVSPASPAVTPPNPQVGQAGGTPVATVAAAPTIPPCTDPGPFAYNPPAQTPLETSGAHSPAGNAATPPSVLPNSSQMAPAQPATPQSKKP